MGNIKTKKCACKDHEGDSNLPADLEHFSVDSSSTTGLSSWCKICQRKRYTPKNAGALDLNDFMQDSIGRLVHVDNVEEIDKTRDGLVKKLVKDALEQQEALVKFKENAMSEIEAFVELSAQEYDVSIGGKKGNMTLQSFDGKYKVQVQISENLVFDERLQIAKKMIDECLTNWTNNSRSEVKTIINDAFNVNQEGKINVRKILSLRRHKIDDPLWLKAMKAISDGLLVNGSKSYMRIYERVGIEDTWQNISLDFASL